MQHKGNIEITTEGFVVNLPLFLDSSTGEWVRHSKHFNWNAFNYAFNFLREQGGTTVTGSELIEEVLYDAEEYGIREEVIDLANQILKKKDIDRVDAYIQALHRYIYNKNIDEI